MNRFSPTLRFLFGMWLSVLFLSECSAQQPSILIYQEDLPSLTIEESSGVDNESNKTDDCKKKGGCKKSATSGTTEETVHPILDGFTCSVCDEEKQSAPPEFGGPWYSRPKLTGNWAGHRNHLAEKGITIDVLSTNFYQGVASGGRREEFAFGGRMDYYFKMDGQKLGLWEGFFLDIHGTTRYGDDINSASGLISAPNIAMLFPSREQDSAVTSFKFTQALSENVMVYLGKINFLDEYLLNFSSGRGVDRFMNASLVIPTILGRTVPYSTYAAGFAVLHEKQPVFNFLVYDPVDRATNLGLDDLFDQGAGVLAQATLPVKPFGLPGHQSIGATWSSRSYTELDAESFLIIPRLGVVQPSEISGSWNVFYTFDQYLWVNPCNEKQGLGMFGTLGISDGNPNPIKWFANLGIGGNVPLRCRGNDTFGIGYFYLGLSDSFKDLAPRLVPQNDEHGLEMYYNFAVTPWCQITADLQIANPFNQTRDTVIIPGFRGRIDF